MGFDNECILNIQSLAGEYFCPVCRLLVYPNEALQSQCTHLYCKPCLTYIVSTTRACPYDGYLVTEADSKPLTESNKALAETIGKIAVHCLYHRSGCPWQGPLSDCTSHCSGCAFGNYPVVCNRCGIQIVHRQVQEHAQNCPGVQPQAQQTGEAQENAAAGTAAATDQTQAATQAGVTTSQAQTSQTTAVITSGQDLNQQANSNSQAQAVVQAAVPTPEQWYQQQQQQYQQYYQQYPGYDPYQQYPQYYPYQQYQQQQVQAEPANLAGQHPSQAYMQPQPQPQIHPQPQAQSQSQAQTQAQAPVQPQPQPQPQPHAQSQPHSHVQAPTVATPQQQLHPAVQPQSQIQPQTHPSAHGLPASQAQSYPQAQPHPQSQMIQPHPQQHLQMPQYQQPHLQMQHPQPQMQPQPHLQPHPQHHILPQPQLQPQPHSQAQPQTQPQQHSQPHPPLHSQSSQLPNPNVQPQTQHASAHAVTGHHSYPQPQSQQQMQLGGTQHHPMHMHPHGGPHQQPQHPVQMQTQFPQQPAQLRPPQSHAPIPNQQQPALLPSPGQVPGMPAAQQQPVHPHAQQPVHPVHQHPVMQPIQHPMPQQYLQQQIPFSGQPSGSVQNQSHHQGPFIHQQQQQLPIQSQLRPQGLSHTPQQLSQTHPQPLQNIGLSHGVQPYQSQRPMMPNIGVQSQQFPQSPGGVASAGQVRPMQLGANQSSANQNFPLRSNNQPQSFSEQQLGYMQHSQSGVTFKSPATEQSLPEREVEPSSQKNDKDVANKLAKTFGAGADSVDIKTVKSETDMKSLDEKHKPVGEDENGTSQAGVSVEEISESKRMLGTERELHAMEHGEPIIRKTVKEEVIESTLEPSAGGESENFPEEKKGLSSLEEKEIQDSSLLKNSPSQQAEFLEEQSGKMQKGAVDAGRSVQPSPGTGKGLQVVPSASTPIPSVASKGSIPESERKMLHQHGYPDRSLPQGQVTSQVPGFDEYRGYPPPGHVHSGGFVQPSHPVPVSDHGRHQPMPIHYGPSPHQQRPAGPSMLQAMPPLGPPHHEQVPPTQLRPHGPGHLPHTGQPLNLTENFNQPGGIPGPGSAGLFGRGPSNFSHPQGSFELQSVASQGHYNQNHVPPGHTGPPRISQGETVGGPPLGALHSGSFDSRGGMLARAPRHGPDGQMGRQFPNPVEAEMFQNQRRGYLDGRQPDSHLPASLERGPFGHLSGIQSDMTRINGPPGHESSLALGLQDDKFKPLLEERLNPFPLEPGRGIVDRGEFEDDLKQFPKPSHLEAGPGPKFGNFLSSSRPVDKAPLGLDYETGLQLDSSASTGPSRFPPPYHPGGALHPNDAGERPRPLGFREDNTGRPDFRSHPDFLGPVSGYGQHRIDGLPPRSPFREYPGIPSRGFGAGVPATRSGLDDIDGRDPRRFGEVPNPFNLPADPIGNSFHESRFPNLPGHLRRNELEGNVNLRMGERFGQDILPGHFRRGEHLDPRNLPSHLRLGDPVGFGTFASHARLGEPFGIGNKPSLPRLGEPGFRSSYSLQGYPNDGGFHMGDMESFDNPRKRRPASMGWCRICKIDCETVEGLEMHSQTREHQKTAMDMVLSIKQQNAKKRKLPSNDHSSVDDVSKPREGRGNKH